MTWTITYLNCLRYRVVKKLTIISVLFLLGAPAFVHAQDPQFTQFYAFPIYLNPAFAGSTGDARVVAIYRDQWPGLESNFVTTAIAYDHYVRKYRSGFGVMVKNDRQGVGASTPIQSTDLSAVYSYLIPVNDRWGVQAGLQVGYGMRNMNYNAFLFGDQLTDRGPDGRPTSEVFGDETLGFFDFSSGVLAFSETMWFGLAVHHINQPNLSFLGGNDPLPRKVSFHGGYRISLTRGKGGRPITDNNTITPVFDYRFQGKSDQLSVGMYYNYNPLLVGVWYRGLPIKRYENRIINQDALAFLFGVKVKGFVFGYSYDATINDLQRESAGSHEISLTYNFQVNFDHAKRGKSYPKIVCPDPWKRGQRLNYQHTPRNKSKNRSKVKNKK